MTRAEIKRQKAKCIHRRRLGEVYEQIWRLPDGRLYGGDDWYSDVDAQVYAIDILPYWAVSNKCFYD